MQMITQLSHFSLSSQAWSSHYQKNRVANMVQEAADSLATYRATFVPPPSAKGHNMQMGSGRMGSGEVAWKEMLVASDEHHNWHKQ